ncbi:MAG: methyltransferase, FkbM family domain protein [Ferruginibacter sp.]|uniref:FkbM family methyltransferase n=1 Tax=Ferruginibacter sp. TaxID=1940288 RepID=UPI0026595FFA|nr:FkbM family methyltransferase [Ferruginibacter sp.]MDB5279445.1 methyltransferase, FkbM family domain protein [Ferruginibacter sp.]
MSGNSFLQNISNGISLNLKRLASNPYKKINLNWFKIKYYKHLPAGKTKTHLLFGKSLYFTDSIQLVNGLEEIFIEEMYRQELIANPFIIDCGANIGLSVIYMKRLYPDAEIIAFEPDETNFQLLSKNIASFGYSNVHLRKEAIWLENTVLQFSNQGTMTSKIEMEASAGTIDVKAVRLRDLLDREVDFLKIDIEGAEYKVLCDIADKLYQVKNMFLEYHGTFAQNKELTAMFEMISRAGFNYYIKEAATLFDYPFQRTKKSDIGYDVQLNIFCFRV